MSARTYRDLTVWQLSSELRDEIVALTAGQPWVEDRRFRDQVRDAAAAVPANIAEGFGRYTHPDFARFAVIARSSLNETMNHLDDAFARGYIGVADLDRLRMKGDRTMRSLVTLIRYLQTTPTPLR
jgi:four helix bundle protein